MRRDFRGYSSHNYIGITKLSAFLLNYNIYNKWTDLAQLLVVLHAINNRVESTKL